MPLVATFCNGVGGPDHQSTSPSQSKSPRKILRPSLKRATRPCEPLSSFPPSLVIWLHPPLPPPLSHQAPPPSPTYSPFLGPHPAKPTPPSLSFFSPRGERTSNFDAGLSTPPLLFFLPWLRAVNSDEQSFPLLRSQPLPYRERGKGGPHPGSRLVMGVVE